MNCLQFSRQPQLPLQAEQAPGGSKAVKTKELQHAEDKGMVAQPVHGTVNSQWSLTQINAAMDLDQAEEIITLKEVAPML